MYISAIRTNDEVLVWERTKQARELKIFPAPYYLYANDPNGTYTSIYGDKLTRLDFNTSDQFNQAKDKLSKAGYTLFESDIAPELKVLSEHYYNAEVPTLHVTFLDIEVDYVTNLGFASVSNPYAPINSVTLYHTHLNKYVVLAIPPNLTTFSPTPHSWKPGKAPASFIESLGNISPLSNDIQLDVTFYKDERDLLKALVREIEDSDVICGWNSDMFDIPYIGKRLEKMGKHYLDGLSFTNSKRPNWREIEAMGTSHTVLDIHGRISADYMVLFKKYEVAERPSYKLMSIAEEILPELPKLEYEGTLADLYRNDFGWFIRYNIRDVEILRGFEDKLGYVELANQMMHLSTGVWKHVTGTLKLAELAMINYCHHVLGGLIVNDTNVPDDDRQIQGASVLDPKIGMHEWIGSVDINSLYPSVIRSINISPETIRGQFLEETKAAAEIAQCSSTLLTLEHSNGTYQQDTAANWRMILCEKKWAVSGFGTVFDQNKQGIIPRILADWYATRKQYQKKKNEARAQADAIITKYRPQKV